MDYLTVKFLHVLSSIFLFGTGVGSAFYLFLVTLDGEVRTVAIVSRCVVWADWLFTATTAVIQPLTGFWLLRHAALPLTLPWVAWSIALYALAIACWLPVLWLQMRMRDLSAAAAATGTPLPPAFHRCFRAWMALGFPALFAFVAIVYLMVARPS